MLQTFSKANNWLYTVTVASTDFIPAYGQLAHRKSLQSDNFEFYKQQTGSDHTLLVNKEKKVLLQV